MTSKVKKALIGLAVSVAAAVLTALLDFLKVINIF